MDSMKNLSEQMEEEPEIKTRYDSQIELAIRVANAMPIIHAVKAKYFPTLKQLQNMRCELPVSNEDWSNKDTIDAENCCHLGRNLYFYAGRSHMRFGDASFAFDASREDEHTGSATPFDTGEAYRRLCKIRHSYEAAAYVHWEQIDLEQWRNEFAKYLAAYFSPISNYWTIGPCKRRRKLFEVPEGDANDNWQLWAFEVRFKEGENLLSATRWSSNKAYWRCLKRVTRNAPKADRSLHRTLKTFNERYEGPQPVADHAAVIEKWVLRTLGLEQ